MSTPGNAIRRIVTIDDADGISRRLSDGVVTDVKTDPARPCFASTRLWVAPGGPLSTRTVSGSAALPHTIEPPPSGSVFRIVTFPPEDATAGTIGRSEVETFFRLMGSPSASTYSAQAPHPYMQKTRTLDFCIVLEGEITLVLDTGEVHLSAGDTVVQRGTNHAWSNRSTQPCRIAIALQDAAF